MDHTGSSPGNSLLQKMQGKAAYIRPIVVQVGGTELPFKVWVGTTNICWYKRGCEVLQYLTPRLLCKVCVICKESICISILSVSSLLC
jgi:hypothetical protein